MGNKKKEKEESFAVGAPRGEGGERKGREGGWRRRQGSEREARPRYLVVFSRAYTRDLSSLTVTLPLAAMPPAPNRALPTKEAKLFREVLNHYESRALKNGLKTADQILKKFPDHGGRQTLSRRQRTPGAVSQKQSA